MNYFQNFLHLYIFPNLGYLFLIFIFLVKLLLLKILFNIIFKGKEEIVNKQYNDNNIKLKGRRLKQSKFINYTEFFNNYYQDKKSDTSNKKENKKEEENNIEDFLQFVTEKNIIDDFFGKPQKALDMTFFKPNENIDENNNDLIIFESDNLNLYNKDVENDIIEEKEVKVKDNVNILNDTEESVFSKKARNSDLYKETLLTQYIAFNKNKKH